MAPETRKVRKYERKGFPLRQVPEEQSFHEQGQRVDLIDIRTREIQGKPYSTYTSPDYCLTMIIKTKHHGNERSDNVKYDRQVTGSGK